MNSVPFRYVFSVFSIALVSFLYAPEGHKRSFLETAQTDMQSFIHEAAREIGSLEQDVNELERIWGRYRASVYARLSCEKPDGRSSQPASVSTTSPIQEEEQLLAARRTQVKASLEELLGIELADDSVPVIGFCGSGGGVRAQYGTLGWLRAAERLKLLDTVQYVSGLSGSTWAFNPWIASQLTVKDYAAQVVPRLSKSLEEQLKSITPDDEKDLFMMLARSYFDKRFLSPVDLYGWLLGYLFLKKLPHVHNTYDFTMSSLSPQIASGKFPFVISTSVIGSTEQLRREFGYSPTVEFSPLSAGSFEARFFIPTWALGRTFKKGVAQTTFPRSLFPEAYLADDVAERLAPDAAQWAEALGELVEYLSYHNYYGREFPLAHLMGICGSAFCVDLQNLLLELMTQSCDTTHYREEWSVVLTMLQEVLADELGKLSALLSEGEISQRDATHDLNNDQFGAAMVPNPVYELLPHTISSTEDVALIDAGLGVIELARCNLGIMPLLHRGVDCIFICDSSADYYQAPSLRAAEALAEKSSLPFPRISYDTINAHEVALIIDEDNPQAPIIVYLPLAANTEYSKKIGHPFNPHADEFNALQFCYSPQMAEDLMGLVEFLVEDNHDLWIEALRKAVERKRARLSST